jgi:hypothetical protein
MTIERRPGSVPAFCFGALKRVQTARADALGLISSRADHGTFSAFTKSCSPCGCAAFALNGM